jgi:outer membrane receptor protein involved in Fe transport
MLSPAKPPSDSVLQPQDRSGPPDARAAPPKPRQTMPTPLIYLLRRPATALTSRGPWLALALVWAASPAVHAQQAPAPASSPESRKDVVIMAPFAVEEDPAGYQMLRSTTGTRLNTDLRDVPQSLSILPKDFLDDTMSASLADALTYVPNVQPRQNVPDGVKIRGIRTTRKYYNNYLVPGFVAGLANVARVEILKGPASAIYGRGELGGVVNHVSLQPSDERRTTLRLTGASQGRYEAKIDTTGPVPLGRGFSYRLSANYLEADSYADFAKTRQYGFFPSVKWQITRNTTATYDGIFFKGLTPGNEGTPFLTSFHDGSPPNMPEVFAPRSLNTSGSRNGNEWDRDHFDANVHFASITHSFGSFLYLRQGATVYERRRDIWKMAISNIMRRNAATGVISLARAATHTDGTEEGTILQGDVIAKYSLLRNSFLASRHETLAGYEYTDTENRSQRFPGTIGDLVVYAPDYSQTVTVRAMDQNTTSSGNTYGYFVHHVSRFWNDRLQFSVSKRWDDAKSSSTNLLRNTSSRTNPKSTSAPRYGVSFRATEWVTAYALRSEQEDPVTTLAVWSGLPGGHPEADQRFTNQVTGTINEGGLKFELFKRRLSLTFAYFEMIRDGFIRSSNLTAAEYQMLGLPLGQAGISRNVVVQGETSKGFEVEWAGLLTPKLSVFGGYGRMDAEGESRGVRAPTRGNPDYKLTTFVKYDLRNRNHRGFQVKGGVSALGPQYSNQFTEIATKHKATQRYDAGATYSWDRYTIDVLVKNVFDELQVINAIAPGSNLLAPPRELWVSLNARW